MTKRSIPIFLAIIAFSAMNVSVFAKTDSGDTITANVKLTATTTIGTTQLAAGDYKVTADGSKAKFEQGNKVVAEVPCTLKDFNGKINQNSVVLDNNKLIEIQVSGKNKTIDF